MKRAILTALFLVSLGLTSAWGTYQEKTVTVIIDTSLGKIKADLYPDKADKTVENFLKYVDDKHYDDTLFHCVMANMIQGGGMVKGMKEKKTRDPLKYEATGLSNKRGTLAMARSSVPDSAASQFFINVVDNDRFDRANARDGVGYVVFGKIVDADSMRVVDAINAVETKGANVPVEDVVIKSIRRQ
jgi:cyclophilin family peptidyl-prolyl cis-trans isomerase